MPNSLQQFDLCVVGNNAHKLDEVNPGHEPSKAEDGHHTHGDGKSKNVMIKLGQGCVASVARPLVKINVWLGSVQAKSIGGKGAKIARVGDLGDCGIRILDDESVHVVGEGLADVGCLDAAVPRVCHGSLEGHVGRKSPRLRDGRAANENINGSWGAEQVGVIPAPGDVVANSVEGSTSGKDTGRLQHNISWGGFGIERGVCRPLLLASRLVVVFAVCLGALVVASFRIIAAGGLGLF